MKFIEEKKHRLNSDIYSGYNIVSFTNCVKGRELLFTSDSVFKTFEEILLNELVKNNCDAYVYLFMPDHFHTLIGGKNEEANSKICMDKFKQKAGYWLTKNMNRFQLQKDYYDHILRNKETLEIKIKYILMNPVRKNIVNYWKDYKYKGSTVYNLDEWE